MKIVSIIALLLTLAACRTVDFNSEEDRGTEYSAAEPAQNVAYPDEGVSFEWGGSMTIDSYAIHRKKRNSDQITP